MLGRWLVTLHVCLLPLTAVANEGWLCAASSQWSMCAPGTDDCVSHTSAVQTEDTNRNSAEHRAIEACHQQTHVERLRAAWIQAPSESPTTTRVDSACALSSCTQHNVEVSPLADAFDDPVCIEVRVYICELCGANSPLCDSVKMEQPVTASACADTHVRLEAFSGFLGQVDSVQPGTWSDARRELCGQ
ncbi:MAG: hypothetical protein ACJAZO_004625 [Myxococcota bacterium]|jgi:hypothetical protein